MVTSLVPSGNVPSIWISGIISGTPSITASTARIVDAEAHDLGDRSAVADQLEDLRRDQRDRFGMIQFEAARAALSRELAGGKNQQLVDFARSQMHGSVL